MRIVFMGSPALAVPSLRALIDAGHELALVVAQPPHEAGRGRREVQPPVAQEALARDLPLFQPERLRRPEAVARVPRWRNWLTGEALEVPRAGDPALGLQAVFAGAQGLPFAVLVPAANE